MNDPSVEFGTPEAVLGHPNLTKAEKIRILKRWEYDEREIDVAVEEGMPDSGSDLLDRVLHALDVLTGGVDAEHSPPTKQGGV